MIKKSQQLLPQKKFLEQQIGKKRVTSFVSRGVHEQKITDAIEAHQQLENKAFEQDIALKQVTLRLLFIFLASETVVIFLFALLQGTHFFGFHLEEWSFKLLMSATILQITFMLTIAVRHLFPNK